MFFVGVFIGLCVGLVIGVMISFSEREYNTMDEEDEYYKEQIL